MAGVVLGFVTLIWVATRPSQSPQARLESASMPAASEDPTLDGSTSRANQRQLESPTPTEAQPDGVLSADLVAAQPETTEGLFLPQETPTPRPSASRQPDTPNTTDPDSREEITTTRFHIVQNGETLSAIAQQYYGSASRWRSIVEANQDTIKNPDRISPGTKLIIP